MAATAAMISQLRRMVDEPDDTTYDDDLLSDYIEKYPLVDALGTDSQDVDFSTTPPTISEKDNWIPTYDLHAAAAEIWEEKASGLTDEFDFSADGGKYSRSQKYDQYMSKARFHLSRRAVSSTTVWVEPRLDSTEETNED